MNVLALVTDAFGGYGGIAQYNRDLITALAGNPGANRITVLPRVGEFDGRLLSAGVRQLRPRKNRIIYSLQALVAAAAGKSFDCVYCGHLHLAPLAAIVAWFLGVPLWLQLHGQEAWDNPGWIKRWAAERAGLITAVSRYTRRRFLAVTGVDPLRVRVLPNTVDARFFPGPKSDVLLERYGVRDKTILLTVGRLEPDERGKGHDKVIAALPEILRTFPEVVYLIVGQGDDRARLEVLARRLGVENAVLFTGGITADELPDLYRLADLFVMPSTQEGFGIAFLEAAASGIRVIAGNADGSMDALADGAVGTVIDPENPAALAGAIRQGLTGAGPAFAGVRQFAFENFAGGVHDLIGERLAGALAAGAR